MNILPIEKQEMVIGALAEGTSIRSIERMTKIHRDSIMRLGVRIGQGCARLMDKTMINLPSKRIQIDEIWGFVGKKKLNILPNDNKEEVGDFWTYIAEDADTKLVPCYLVGKRCYENTHKFMQDLSIRFKNRIQLSSDGLNSYANLVKIHFGGNIDYGQIVKTYKSTEGPKGKYSPPEMVISKKYAIIGNPDQSKISTSFIESQNLTVRMHCRRLTRLTNAFSKKLDNFIAAIGLHFGYYNFVKIHSTLHTTPAVATGIENHAWTVKELIKRVQ